MNVTASDLPILKNTYQRLFNRRYGRIKHVFNIDYDIVHRYWCIGLTLITNDDQVFSYVQTITSLDLTNYRGIPVDLIELKLIPMRAALALNYCRHVDGETS